MNADSELREVEKIYYPQPLRIAPSSTPTLPDLSSASLASKPAMALTSVPSSKKEKEKQTQSPIMELGPEEVIEVEQ